MKPLKWVYFTPAQVDERQENAKTSYYEPQYGEMVSYRCASCSMLVYKTQHFCRGCEERLKEGHAMECAGRRGCPHELSATQLLAQAKRIAAEYRKWRRALKDLPIRIITPGLIKVECGSIQPMDKPAGQILTIKPDYKCKTCGYDPCDCYNSDAGYGGWGGPW